MQIKATKRYDIMCDVSVFLYAVGIAHTNANVDANAATWTVANDVMTVREIATAMESWLMANTRLLVSSDRTALADHEERRVIEAGKVDPESVAQARAWAGATIEIGEGAGKKILYVGG